MSVRVFLENKFHKFYIQIFFMPEFIIDIPSQTMIIILLLYIYMTLVNSIRFLSDDRIFHPIPNK